MTALCGLRILPAFLKSASLAAPFAPLKFLIPSLTVPCAIAWPILSPPEALFRFERLAVISIFQHQQPLGFISSHS